MQNNLFSFKIALQYTEKNGYWPIISRYWGTTILESKIIYFCLRSNYLVWTTLKFRKTSKSWLFGNIFVNNWLKHFVLMSLNDEVFYPFIYSKEKINCQVFYKLESFMWMFKNKCLATFAQKCIYIYIVYICIL